MSGCSRILLGFVVVLVLENILLCFGLSNLELEPKRKTTNTKTLKDVVVGDFRIKYTFPSVIEPPDDTAQEDAIYQSLYYLRDVLPAMIGVEDIGQDVYSNWTYSDDELIADWYNYRVTYDSDKDLSPKFVFKQVNKSISFNESYTAYMQLLVTTPFVSMDHAEISDYVEGTSYPTIEPFPTPNPNSATEPTPSPTQYPTPSMYPVFAPIVTVYAGNLTVAYTSPGISKPDENNFVTVITTNDYYFYQVVYSLYPDYYISTSYSSITFEYIDPDSSPNLYTYLSDYTFYFEGKINEVPTTEMLQQIIIDSVNSTNIDLVNGLDAKPFGTVTEAIAEFTDEVPAPSPTRYPTIPDNTPEPTIVLTDAPVAKSKRKPHAST